MTENDTSEKTREFEALIKKHGLKEAMKIMRSTGALYQGDYVEDNKKNPIFTEEEIERLARHLQPEKVEATIANQEPDWGSFSCVAYEFEGQLKRVEQEVSPPKIKMVYQ